MVTYPNLGYMYENGTGVPQSFEEAAVWYRKSAEQGDVWAQVGLGMMYDDGSGVEQSYEEAVAWYRRAADQGYADAQFLMGRMYEDGTGVEQSLDEAIGWYRKAAEQGNVPAEERLAELDGQSGERCRSLYYGRVDVSHPHSEHHRATDMGRRRVPRTEHMFLHGLKGVDDVSEREDRPTDSEAPVVFKEVSKEEYRAWLKAIEPSETEANMEYYRKAFKQAYGEDL